MSLGMGSTSPMYAASGNRGAVAANQGPLGRTFTPSKPGDGLRAFADNASVTVVNSSGDVLTAVASTLLNAKAVRLEGASLTPKEVHVFCDHVFWYNLYTSMQKTITVDQANIAQTRKQFSE